MKHIYPYLLPFFMAGLLIFSSLAAIAQKGVINTGAHIQVEEGAYLKVEGSLSGNFFSLPFDTLNPSIELDGMLMIQGNWYDGTSGGSVFAQRNGLGCVVFNGDVLQSADGQNSIVFENLELHNPEGMSLQSHASVEKDMILEEGLLRLNDNHLLLDTGSAIKGTFTKATMIVADGSGQLRKRFTSNTTFTFPVGDDTGDPQYTPMQFTLTGHSSLSSPWVGVNLKNEQHAYDTSSSDYISRYWELQSQGISDPLYEASFHFSSDDIHGDASNIYNAFIQGGVPHYYEKADIPGRRVFFGGMESFGAYTGTSGLDQIIPKASGNWTDRIGETTASINVLIPDGITIYLQASKAIPEVRDLTLEPGASLTVDDSLYVSGSLYLEADSTGAASLIQGADNLQINGQSHVQSYLSAVSANGHGDEVGTPVQAAIAGVFGPLPGENHLYSWKEATGEYIEIIDPGEVLEVLKGYEVESSDARTISFQGSLHAGDLAAELNRSSGSAYPGFHLVSNPYTAFINWDTTLWNNASLQHTLWYRHDGNFATYNRMANVGVNGGQPILAPMQAFWVRVSEESASGFFRTNQGIRTHQRPQPVDDDQPYGDKLLRLKIESEDGYSDEMALGFLSQAHNAFDDYDAEKRFAAGFPQIYTGANGHKLAINSLAEFAGPYEVPLVISIPQQGDYTLIPSNLDSFDHTIEVILEDQHLGAESDMREQSFYRFNTDEGVDPNRFVLHLAKGQTGLSQADQEQTLQVYGYEDQLYIRVHKERLIHKKTTIVLYNLVGQKILEKSRWLNMGLNKLQTHIPAGYYIIQIRQDDNIRSDRIYLEK